MESFKNPGLRVESPDRFKEKFDTILNRPLTVENINEFGDIALNELIELTEKVVEAYRITHSELPSNQKDVEDSAFREYQLGDIEYVLEQVQDKISELK